MTLTNTTTAEPQSPKLAVLISFSGAGGVEKMVMNLVREFAKHLPTLDLLVLRASGPHFSDIPANVNVIHLKSQHTLTAIPELARYMKHTPIQSLLVAKDRATRAAVIARSISGRDIRIVARLGTNLSTALAHRSRVSAWFRTAPMQRLYAKVNKIVAVSEGVAQDTLKITKVEPERVMVIRNPVITEQISKRQDDEALHPWLTDKTTTVIMGVGRLSIQKDFTCLLEAFAKVRAQRECKLIILGEGKLRESLESNIETLGIQADVALPGFQKNVHAWLQAADLFVLSSRWEGSPNALTEALAMGTPSVSTRCPSGPNEVLNEGEFGPLVEVGDAKGLAKAMQEVLNAPLPPETLTSAVNEYRAEISAQHYLTVLGINE
ncbi:MAG: glycosyltransferase [Agarilytica sp.]